MPNLHGNRFKKVTDLLLYPIQITVIYICVCKLFMLILYVSVCLNKILFTLPVPNYFEIHA